MKAIVKIHTGGNAKATVAYLLDPDAKSKRDEMPVEMMTGSDMLEQTGERVAEVFGQGISADALALKNQEEIIKDLEARPSALRRKGKATRHVVISAEFEEGEELSDEEINEKLQYAAEDFIDTFCPGSKFLGVIHRDSSQPHVHLEIENYDCSIFKAGDEPKRLDWSPADVSEMQSMDFTEQFSMGKGSTKNVDKKNAEDIADKSMPMLGRKKLDQALGVEVQVKLADLSLRSDDLVDAIEKLSGHGFEVNRFSKAGALLKKPSVSFGGTTVRFERLEKHLDNVIEFEKVVPIEKPVHLERDVEMVVPVAAVVKISKEVAVDFVNDYKALIATCEKAKGKYQLDKKRDVRIPAVEGFVKSWSDVSDRLDTAKDGLKAKLTTYMDVLGGYADDDFAYEVPEMDEKLLQGLNIHGGLEKAPAKKKATVASVDTKKKCTSCGKLNCECGDPFS